MCGSSGAPPEWYLAQKSQLAIPARVVGGANIRRTPTTEEDNIVGRAGHKGFDQQPRPAPGLQAGGCPVRQRRDPPRRVGRRRVLVLLRSGRVFRDRERSLLKKLRHEREIRCP